MLHKAPRTASRGSICFSDNKGIKGALMAEKGYKDSKT